MIQTLEIANKDFKVNIVNMFKYTEGKIKIDEDGEVHQINKIYLKTKSMDILELKTIITEIKSLITGFNRRHSRISELEDRLKKKKDTN